MDYLYSYVSKAWLRWLPRSTELTLKRGGYYTVLVRPGYRIITLNNNVCYNTNWWVMYNLKQQAVQLNWLHSMLLAAEMAGEKVHLLLHQPTGVRTCYSPWAREFHKIVDRFHRTIVAQFNGHTHNDEFNLFYAREGGQQHAVSVGWNGGSTSTFTNRNPGYRVYSVDRETLEVNDAITYWYNVTEANETPEKSPIWRKLYSFRETYDLEDLSPASLNQLVYRFAEDKTLLKTYWEYRRRLADPILKQGCDNDCLFTFLCRIVENIFNDLKKCDELREIYYQER